MPDEIAIILSATIELYIVNGMPCSQHVRAAEGFFRLNRRNPGPGTEHSEYVNSKISEIYEIAKNLNRDVNMIMNDYLLDSGSMIGVYIREDLGWMVGNLRGCRADKMTEEEFNKYGKSRRLNHCLIEMLD